MPLLLPFYFSRRFPRKSAVLRSGCVRLWLRRRMKTQTEGVPKKFKNCRPGVSSCVRLRKTWLYLRWQERTHVRANAAPTHKEMRGRKPALVRTRVLARSRHYQPRNKSFGPNNVAHRRETPTNITLTTIVANTAPEMFTRITQTMPIRTVWRRTVTMAEM